MISFIWFHPQEALKAATKAVSTAKVAISMSLGKKITVEVVSCVSVDLQRRLLEVKRFTAEDGGRKSENEEIED